jgi:hypothetical protein
MATPELPAVGGGYQIGDGLVSEQVIGTQAAPLTAAGDATLSVDQVLGGILLGSPGSSAAAYTLPTVASLEAVLTAAKVNSSFDLSVVNVNGSGGGVITMTGGGVTGWTVTGLATVAAVAGTAAHFRARKSSATAWVLYRVG